MPVLLSVALDGWIIDESLVRKTLPISEYTNLLATVIGTSKSLFKTALISLSEELVAEITQMVKKIYDCLFCQNLEASEAGRRVL